MSTKAKHDLASLYPQEQRGANVIAYLWARTIVCEGPQCGAKIPLIRALDLDKRTGMKLAIATHGKNVGIKITDKQSATEPTIRGGSATCPVCGFVTGAKRVRSQLSTQRGGANDALCLCIVVSRATGLEFQPSGIRHQEILGDLAKSFRDKGQYSIGDVIIVPPVGAVNPVRPAPNTRGVSAVTSIGISTFSDLFSARQLVAIGYLARLVERAYEGICKQSGKDIAKAAATCLACAVDRLADYNSSLCTWVSSGCFIGHAYTKQALSNVWDFAEVYPFSAATGSFQGAVEWIVRVLKANVESTPAGATVVQSDARDLPLPADSVDVFFTDPPYYAEIPYGDIGDFFYVWLRKSLGGVEPDLLNNVLVDRTRELIVTQSCQGIVKDSAYFEGGITECCIRLREVAKPSSVGVIVFANSKTHAWEAMLAAILEGGFQIVGSWPIDTEMPTRTRARGAASLQSSIHLVCRPRENLDGSVRTDEIGDWRDVLTELPRRIQEWMPRLAEEGVMGADAIFACLGPALEIFSRYSRVEKASGEVVSLKEYLEQVWAAVAKEALTMIFTGADATGFEEDARLTAMWLWTLKTGDSNDSGKFRRGRRERRGRRNRKKGQGWRFCP